MYRDKMKSFASKSAGIIFHQIVLQGLSQIEILQHFIDLRIESLNCFDYLALPKFSLEINNFVLAEFQY